MADVTQNKVGSFAALLAEQANDLPKISFRNNLADLAATINILRDGIKSQINFAAVPNNAMRDTAIISEIARVYDNMKSDPAMTMCFNEISSLANKIGVGVAQVFNLLSQDIHPTVENLMQQIDTRMQQVLKESGVAIKSNPTNNLRTDFETMQWDDYINRAGGEELICEKFKDITNYGANRSMNDLRTVLTTRNLKMDKLELDPEASADIINRVNEKVTTENEKMMVSRVFTLLTDPYEFSKLVHETVGVMSESNNITEALRRTMKTLTTMAPIAEVFRKTPFDLVDHVDTKVRNNVDTVLKLMDTLNYSIVVARNHYKNALLISRDLVNGDNVTGYYDKGGNLERLAKYVHLMHTREDRPVPYFGVKASTILGLENLEDKFTQLTQKELSQNSQTMHHATLVAARDVMNAYLESTPAERIPEAMSREAFVKFRRPLIESELNHWDMTKDANLESVMYDFVIDTHYAGTAVKMVHEMMGKEVIRQLRVTSELNENNLAIVDATVAARMVTKFLFEKLLVRE